MSYLSIGSGDIGNLLMGKQTKGYADLWRKFLSEHPPYYNSYASPIDALRTGAILEDLYTGYLPDNYFTQVKHQSKEYDVLTSSIDFTAYENGEVVNFEELKTIWFTDFVNKIKPLSLESEKNQIQFLQKKFKKNYQQVQAQLFCTGLDSANITFLSVETYDDDLNKSRIIKEEDVVKFRISRNNSVIDSIKERLTLFQNVKDHFLK